MTSRSPAQPEKSAWRVTCLLGGHNASPREGWDLTPAQANAVRLGVIRIKAGQRCAECGSGLMLVPDDVGLRNPIAQLPAPLRGDMLHPPVGRPPRGTDSPRPAA